MSNYTRSEKDVPVHMFKEGYQPESFAAIANKSAPQILDLPSMKFTEDEQVQNTQTETVTSNGIPLLGLPSMNFEKPEQTKKADDNYMSTLPAMAFDENR